MSNPWQPPQRPQQPKRKSAVELLAESKPFYVKSETVLDRRQEQPLRVNSGLGQAIASGGCHVVNSGLNTDVCCSPYPYKNTKRPSSTGKGLEGTLRILLAHVDSREDLFIPAPQQIEAAAHQPEPAHYGHHNPAGFHEARRDQPRARDTYARASSSAAGPSGPAKHSPERKLTRPRSIGEGRLFFPETPQRLQYSLPSPDSSPESEMIADQIGTISPPAQYAHTAPRYKRSNSHTQPTEQEEPDNVNVDSHKSLPDLHTEVRSYNEQSSRGHTDTVGRTPRHRRHSSHLRAASCSSKGTRSNHSSMISSEGYTEHQPYDEHYQQQNRKAWSYTRDSGGSSGHYTQRSAPTHRQRECSYCVNPAGREPRERDPSASRQVKYAQNTDCVVSAPAQFQDGATNHPPPIPALPMHSRASVPPPLFADDLTYEKFEAEAHKPGSTNIGAYGRIEHVSRSRKPDPPPQSAKQTPKHHESRARQQADNTQLSSPEEVASPLGTFTRQRNLRYKQKKSKQIMRSKSDISDRYRRPESRNTTTALSEDDPQALTQEQNDPFYTYLGIEPIYFERVVNPPLSDKPKFFSSASTVDSNFMDLTVQGPTQRQIYRNPEPPSVVERNARIVKWLCQCRKAQSIPLEEEFSAVPQF